MIGYYNPSSNNIKNLNFFLEKENIIIIVFSYLLAFVFGMYTNRKITNAKKNKANELDESFEYEHKEDNFDKNNREEKDDKDMVNYLIN